MRRIGLLATALLCACPAPPSSAPADAAVAIDLALIPCPDAQPATDTTCEDTGLWCHYPLASRDELWCLCHQGGDARRSKWQCWEETCPAAATLPPALQSPTGACTPGDTCAIRTWEADTACRCLQPEAVWRCCVLGRPDSCTQNTKSGEPCCMSGATCGACTCELPTPDGGASGNRWRCR